MALWQTVSAVKHLGIDYLYVFEKRYISKLIDELVSRF